MEVRGSYKQTNIGLIPESWQVKPLRNILSKGRLGGNYPNELTASNFPLMKMGNLGRGGFDVSKIEYIRSGVVPEEQHRLAYGDVIFNTRNTLDLVGKIGIWRNELPVAYYNSNLMRFEFDSHEIFSPEYANYALNTASSISRLRALATGTTSVAAIYTRDLMELEVIVPTMAEQTAIAAALSDVDALIAGLEKLLAKKRDLKQAAMQQLLTGQTRLPGFSGEWDKTVFSEILRHHAGNSSLIKGKQFDRPMPNLFPGFSASGQDVWCSAYEHEGDAIVVSAVGSRCGKAFHATGRWCAIANTHVVWPDETKIDRRFLSFFVNDEDFWLKSGSGQPFVLFKQTFSREVRLPPIIEQGKIADAISDLEAELETLINRLSKTCELKQGMMQELLTGRTRLV